MSKERMIVEIDGMHCEACVRRVTQALTRSGAGVVERVEIGEAAVAAGPETATAVLQALANAGFTARVRPRPK